MRLRNRIAVAALILVAFPGCGEQSDRPSTVALPATNGPVADASPHVPTDNSTIHGYSNGVNRLVERRIDVLDDQGRPAVTEPRGRRFQDVQFQIVWTSPSQYDWNYCIPELHGGKDYRETEYPSEPFFLEKKLGAKTFLEVSVPDTRYSFYIINGHFSPFFFDSEKAVIWQLKNSDLERKFHQMRSVSASSKRIVFSSPGGDCEEFLIVDFSDRENSPKVNYYVRYDGP